MSVRTEILAICEVKSILLLSDIIVPYILENDKTPIWDGDLYVYKKPNNGYDIPKENLLGRIPVQVKGIKVKRLSEDLTKYQFERNDLLAYKEDGGVIIFVGEIDSKDSKKVFYCALLPVDINKLLNQTTELKIKVPLLWLENRKIKNFEDLCWNFIANRKLQNNPTNNIELSVNEAKELMIHTLFRNLSLEDYMLNMPVYLYGKFSEYGSFPVAIKRMDIINVGKKINAKISINNRVFYTKYDFIHYKDCNKLIFDNSLVFTFKQGAANFDYNPHDNFGQRINSIEFIREFINYGGFDLLGKKIELRNLPNDKNTLKGLEQANRELGDIRLLLDIFNIDHYLLNMNEISKEGYNNLNFLIDTMIYNKKVKKIDGIPSKKNFEIGNLNLLTFIYYKKDGEIAIENFSKLDQEMVLIFEKENFKCKANIHVLLTEEEILKSKNINLEIFLNNLIDEDYNPYYESIVVEFQLRIINAYDKKNDESLYSTAIEISKWLMKHNPEAPVNIINEIQLTRRKRELESSEIMDLENLLGKCETLDNGIEIACGVYILTGNKKKFNSTFAKLSEERQEVFKSYPIYILLN